MHSGEPPGDVLHRIKNHLSVILGFADLALESPTIDTSARGDVLEMRKAAEAALSEVAKLDHLRAL